jgi:hypothetical protein
MSEKQLKKALRAHPLAGALISEAIRRYAAEVAASTPADYPKRWLIMPKAWIAAGAAVKECFK